jgi:hypothetical protein
MCIKIEKFTETHLCVQCYNRSYKNETSTNNSRSNRSTNNKEEQ